MIDTSARLLRLLSVLQSRGYWSGSGLAERLEVTPRTLRRDIDRLRSLGYAIQATSGPGGGYRLSQGAALPPLLLNDDEAVAIAAALRSAADAFTGLGETAVGVLVKLNQLLPERLRRRVGALQAVTLSVSATGAAPALDADLLTVIAAACREHELLSFDYRDRGGRVTQRRVEPMRLVHVASRRWYLLAWDLGREDWRTLRVDRVAGHVKPGPRFIPRPLPEDLPKFVTEAITYAPYRYRARFKLAGSTAELAGRVPPWLGLLDPMDETHSMLSIGAESLDALALHVLLCGTDFELIEPDDLRPRLMEIAERLRRGAAPDGIVPDGSTDSRGLRPRVRPARRSPP